MMPGGGMPPLNIGSSATSGDAKGGAASGQGWGALNQGDWIIQRTGTGNNTAVPSPKDSPWLMLAIGAGVVWFLNR